MRTSPDGCDIAADPDIGPEQLLREAAAADDALRAARLREQVVLGHRAFALGLAHRFDHRGVERQDLEQVALLGLVHAARRFQPDRGTSFTAFAAPTIVGEIKRHFRDHGWSVRPPRSLQELHLEVRTATSALSQERGHAPADEQVAERTGRTVEEVRQARSVEDSYRSSSLDAPLGGHEDLTLGDSVAQEEPGYELVEGRVALRPLLAQLSERERLVVHLRFEDELTQRQIGHRIGVSQMQVSRILAAVIHHLRQGLLPAAQH